MSLGSAIVVGEEEDEVALIAELHRALKGKFWTLKEDGKLDDEWWWIESGTFEFLGLNAEMMKLSSLLQKAIDRVCNSDNFFFEESRECVFVSQEVWDFICATCNWRHLSWDSA